MTWRVAVDTGGTFTDCLVQGLDGRLLRAKVLSSGALRARIVGVESPTTIRIESPWANVAGLARGMRALPCGADPGAAGPLVAEQEPGVLHLASPLAAEAIAGGTAELRGEEPAPVLAIRVALGIPAGAALPPIALRLATTRGTNALLERRGARSALVVTEGFADLLLIRDQRRPDLFARAIVRPAPLPEQVIEVDEAIGPDGSIERPLDEDRLRADARRLRGAGIVTAAVVLKHAWRDGRHEHRAVAILAEEGIEAVASAELAPTIGLLVRAETAVVEAYLAPILGAYLRGVERAVGGAAPLVLTSAGGLVRADRYRASDGLLSGPAGGAAGAAAAGASCGFDRVIGFDMGGTSTDVCRVEGGAPIRRETHRVGDAQIARPALAIETVAAGGGSIVAFDGTRLRVGPASAGADPGPACYGAGGPFTLTDANLLLDRLDAERFALPIDAAPARRAFAALRASMAEAGHDVADERGLLEGIVRIADERMADAIRRVSIEEGVDPADHALVAFGGAGGQHACAVAERLGIEVVVLPAEGSLLSAAGLAAASLAREVAAPVLRRLIGAEEALARREAALAEEAIALVVADGGRRDRVVVEPALLQLRLEGQEVAIALSWGPDLDGRFRTAWRRRFGYAPEATVPIEVASMRVTARMPTDLVPAAPATTAAVERFAAAPSPHRATWPRHERADLAIGARLDGPALVLSDLTGAVVPAGWCAERDASGTVILRRRCGPSDAKRPVDPEPVRQELFENALGSAAERMGERLRRTAISTNVRERLDFSCGVLDAEARLVVNAPHMPVHLGALGPCVRGVRERLEIRPGDVVVVNHPAYGGSHLPDVTAIAIACDDAGRRIGYVASRAHHAEIGGTRPGSMPPEARTLAEEGVVIPPTRIVEAGEERFERVAALLRGGPHPTRRLAENLADLRAQVAACTHGVAALRAIAARFGPAETRRRMAAIGARAARLGRAALSAIPDGEADLPFDDGAALRVSVRARPGAGPDEPVAVIDFAGTDGVLPGNLNATPAIVRAAVVYALRLLVGARLPLAEGLLDAVELRLPAGSLLDPPFDEHDPSRCPAVVGGNVETSQRVVAILLRAMGLAAASQGTMNNVLFGDATFGYYETVCGGAGAGPDHDGASATHVHMTNTRITDPEILEQRYPVRLERFAVRRGSGGAGRHRGGDGAIRVYRFLAPLALSLLTQDRRQGPRGAEGGGDGAAGRQTLIRADGTVTVLPAIASAEVRAGDRLRLETPGGGGWGKP